MPVCLCLHKQASVRTSTCPSFKIFVVPCTAFLKNRRAGYTSIKQQHSTLNSVIPGQDQGPYSNDGTNACDRISILQSMNISFQVLARDDIIVTLPISRNLPFGAYKKYTPTKSSIVPAIRHPWPGPGILSK